MDSGVTSQSRYQQRFQRNPLSAHQPGQTLPHWPIISTNTWRESSEDDSPPRDRRWCRRPRSIPCAPPPPLASPAPAAWRCRRMKTKARSSDPCSLQLAGGSIRLGSGTRFGVRSLGCLDGAAECGPARAEQLDGATPSGVGAESARGATAERLRSC